MGQLYPLAARRKEASIEPPPRFANTPIAEAPGYLPVTISGVVLDQAISLGFANTGGFATALSHYSGAPVFTTAATGTIGTGIAATATLSGSYPAVGGGNTMADMTREEIDAKIAASEARADTKIASIDGKLDLVISKLDSAVTENRITRDSIILEARQIRSDVREDNRAARVNQITLAIGVIIIVIAVIALVPVIFGWGTQIHDIVRDEMKNLTVTKH